VSVGRRPTRPTRKRSASGARAAGAGAGRAAVREGLARLGVRNLVLAIHDVSFPSDAEEDTGRGSPYSETGARFLRFVRSLGFTGIQLGPQGQTSAGNPSPYDATLFSRSFLSISLSRLAEDDRWEALLPRATLRALVAARAAGSEERVPYAVVYRIHAEALGQAFARFQTRSAASRARPDRFAARFEDFCQRNEAWLERDALFSALELEHAGAPWQEWGEDTSLRASPRVEALAAKHRDALQRYRFVQWIAHEQHRTFVERAHQLGLQLYGDMQIGLSERDAWAFRDTLLPGYWMGAPPSRTNPEGQAWHHPVLDPDRYFEDGAAGPAIRFLEARVEKLLDEFDGLRIDHPHGLVCPWVYRADDPDPLRATRAGARLFSSPDLPDHPELARFAIASRAQLNPKPGTPRYADDWVVDLTPEQVDRYAVLFDRVVACLRRQGRDSSQLICEVLSTQPYPLERVLARHGLGRFRVTQKADLRDASDVYRSENARPVDWVMLGNHDTEPIWRLLGAWREQGTLEARARYAAERLASEPEQRAALCERFARDGSLLAHGLFADLLVSRAENVMIFFSDLFGLTDVYNRPGVVSAENWSLRLPCDFERAYRDSVASGRALSLPRAIALALRARGIGADGSDCRLLEALDARSIDA